MAMFPVFITGCIAGILIAYVYFTCAKTVPSNTKFKLQEETIKNTQADLAMLEEENEKLRKQIEELATKRRGRKPKVEE